MFPTVVLIIVLHILHSNAQFNEARRPIDLWNPFGTSTTRKPGMGTSENEVVVRMSIGVVIGRRHLIENVPWLIDHDPLEQLRYTDTHFDPNPVPPFNNLTVYSFLGLPYAEPPVTTRRFKSPQLMNQLPGDGPFLAFEYGASCSQEVEARPSLFINDPYPFRASKTSSRNYPVIAFFHGGNFQTGSGNEWPGHVLASRGIVVVTINYRLGPFGFMSLGDTESGNYGIQDQRCALTWLLVVIHSKLQLWVMMLELLALEYTCCHRTLKIEYNRYLFLPTVDGRDLPAHPLYLLNQVPVGGANIYSSVPYLTGLNLHDGSEVILEDRTLGEFTNFLEVDRAYLHSFVIEYAFRHNYTMNREAIIEAIEAYYTYWPDPSDLVTDAYYTAPIDQSAYLHSLTGSRTFFYVNTYNFSASRQNTFDPAERVFPTWMGTCHECDLYLLFGFPFMPRHLLPQHFKNVTWYMVDRNASQLFSTMFRQFIKYSDPNLPRAGLWPAYEPRAHWYLNFTYTEFTSLNSLGTISRDYRYEEVAFWNHYIPSLVNYMTTTFPPSEVSTRRELVTFKIVVSCLVLALILLLVLCLSFGYRLFDRKKYDGTIDRRILVTRQSDYPPTPQHVNMQRISNVVEGLLNRNSSRLCPTSEVPPLLLVSLKIAIKVHALPQHKSIPLPEDITRILGLKNSQKWIIKGIKKKKLHEIERVNELVILLTELCKQQGMHIDEIVDIGAGIGHLSRILSIHLAIPIQTIEGNEQYVRKALNLDVETQKAAKHKGSALQVPNRRAAFINKHEQIGNKTNDDDVLFVNPYRAALEWLLLGLYDDTKERVIDPSARHQRMRSVKHATQMDFWSYAKLTTADRPKQQKLIERLETNKLVRKKIEQMISESKYRVLLFYALRQMVAPVIESLILVDRKTFLEEMENRVFLIPLFDSFLSPRNLALIAMKRS
ncbi:hypothetical protein M3Y96_00194400 [Aphelenchoides besseyi]|nr:hypothetical protein M3Y96_00194400 [Aphelenchoides besseyi]